MRKTRSKKQGKIIPNGVKPESHELDTILFFTEMGKDVELIVPSNTPGNKRPDFWMDNLEWEVKNPVSNTRRSLERIFYSASSQSQNIVVDLRRVKGKCDSAILVLEKCFRDTRRVRRMYIINKSGTMRFYKK